MSKFTILIQCTSLISTHRYYTLKTQTSRILYSFSLPAWAVADIRSLAQSGKEVLPPFRPEALLTFQLHREYSCFPNPSSLTLISFPRSPGRSVSLCEVLSSSVSEHGTDLLQRQRWNCTEGFLSHYFSEILSPLRTRFSLIGFFFFFWTF